jgi:hypothetical protein
VKVKEQFASESQCVYMDERTLLQNHSSKRDNMLKVKVKSDLYLTVCGWVGGWMSGLFCRDMRLCVIACER